MDAAIKVTNELGMFLMQNPNYMRKPELINGILDEVTASKERYDKLFKQNRLDAFRQVVRDMDELIEEIPTDRQYSVSCKKGCNFCCHFNVDIYFEEAMLIKEYCDQHGIVIDKDYLKEQLTYEKEEIGFSPTHAACVFLKEGMCSIYEARPIACRKYFVATPAEQCDIVKYPPPHRVAGIVDKDVEILVSGLLDHPVERMPAMLLKVL